MCTWHNKTRTNTPRLPIAGPLLLLVTISLSLSVCRATHVACSVLGGRARNTIASIFKKPSLSISLSLSLFMIHVELSVYNSHLYINVLRDLNSLYAGTRDTFLLFSHMHTVMKLNKMGAVYYSCNTRRKNTGSWFIRCSEL